MLGIIILVHFYVNLGIADIFFFLSIFQNLINLGPTFMPVIK